MRTIDNFKISSSLTSSELDNKYKSLEHDVKYTKVCTKIKAFCD